MSSAPSRPWRSTTRGTSASRSWWYASARRSAAASGPKAVDSTTAACWAAVNEYLGHADPGFTLRTYTHLIEDGAERTKRAVDAVFGHSTPADEQVDPASSDPNEQDVPSDEDGDEDGD